MHLLRLICSLITENDQHSKMLIRKYYSVCSYIERTTEYEASLEGAPARPGLELAEHARACEPAAAPSQGARLELR